MLKVVLILIVIVLAVYWYGTINCVDKNEIIRSLLVQSSRWSTASFQDRNPVIAVLHANYGAGYLWAMNDIASADEIEKASGIDYNTFRKHVTDIQRDATQRLIRECPNIAPEPSYLAQLGGEA